MEPQGVVVAGPVGGVLADHDLSRLGVGSDPGGQVDGPSVDVAVLGDDRTGVDADMGGWQVGRRGALDDVQPREHGHPGLSEVEHPAHLLDRPSRRFPEMRFVP
jgi:hypothetical protein